MTLDRVGALEALLAETEAAHGVYETAELNGVYDQDWPRWYAAYAVDHGIGSLLDRPVSADELAHFLAASWDELQRTDPRPTDPWGRYIARRLAEGWA
jgi:hypothetical protein